MLKLQEVSKFYERSRTTVRALDGVSLKLAPGEFVAVRGPSGCGKTTLLLTAGGLLAPSSGQASINGQDLYALAPEQRARFRAETLGFVFQQFHLIPYLNVADNVLAPCLALCPPGAAERAAELIEQFGLTDRRHHLPGELSTGERQRTALARALLNRPKVLLADEPTGNLDEVNAEVVLEHLAGFARSGGAVLLVTHDAGAAARADSSVRMADGKLLDTEAAT